MVFILTMNLHEYLELKYEIEGGIFSSLFFLTFYMNKIEIGIKMISRKGQSYILPMYSQVKCLGTVLKTLHTLQPNYNIRFPTKYFLLCLSCPHSFEIEEWPGTGITLSYIFPDWRSVSSRLWPRLSAHRHPGQTQTRSPSQLTVELRSHEGEDVTSDQCYHVDTVSSMGAVKSDGQLMDVNETRDINE